MEMAIIGQVHGRCPDDARIDGLIFDRPRPSFTNSTAVAERPHDRGLLTAATARTDVPIFGRPPQCRIASLEGTAAPGRSRRGFTRPVNLVYDGNIHDA